MSIVDRQFTAGQLAEREVLAAPVFTVRGSRWQYRIEDFENGLPKGGFEPKLFRWLAWHWGLDPWSTDLQSDVLAESCRRKPCRGCRAAHRDSVDPVWCDRCFMRRVVGEVRDREFRRFMDRKRQADRALAARLVRGMSPARRRYAELSGADLSNPVSVFTHAYDEVLS